MDKLSRLSGSAQRDQTPKPSDSVENAQQRYTSGRAVTKPGRVSPSLHRVQERTETSRANTSVQKVAPFAPDHRQLSTRQSKFETRVLEVCQKLWDLNFDHADPCHACLQVVTEYKKLLKRRDAPSNPKFLNDKIREHYVYQLHRLLDYFQDEIAVQRGRQLIYGLTQILGHTSILDRGYKNYHPIRNRVIALLHKYVKVELSQLEFRLRCKDSRGEAMVIGSLRILLSQTCRKQFFFSVQNLRDYNLQLSNLEKRLERKDDIVDCQGLPFETKIAAGDLKGAGQWVMENENTFFEARMIRDIMYFELNKISAALDEKPQLSGSEKINLLNGLSEYSQYYTDLIGQIPEIKKILTNLCSVMTWQTYLLLLRQSQSKDDIVCQGAKQTLKYISWLKMNNFLNKECQHFIALADTRPEALSIETSKGLLSAERIVDEFRKFMQHDKKNRNREDMKKRMDAILPLLHQKETLLASSWGKIFKKSFDTVEHVILSEYFTDIHEYYMELSNTCGGNYDQICLEMEKFREACVRNKDFVIILRTSDSDSDTYSKASRLSWELLTCKAWGKQLSELQKAQQLTTKDLDFIDELIAITPTVPCIQTRNRLWEVIHNFGCIAEKEGINDIMKHRLSNLLNFVDNFPGVWTQTEETYKENVRSIRDRLKKSGKLALPQNTVPLLLSSTTESITKTAPLPSLSAQVKSVMPEESNTQLLEHESASTNESIPKEPTQTSTQLSEKPAQTKNKQPETTAQTTSSPSKQRQRKKQDRPDYQIYQPPEMRGKSTTVSNPSSFTQAENLLGDRQPPSQLYIPEACVPVQLPLVWLKPIALVGVTYEHAATCNDRVRFGFGYLDQTISNWPQTQNGNIQQRDELTSKISIGLTYIYDELKPECHTRELQLSIHKAMQKFLKPDEEGAIANAIEPLKQHLLAQGQLLMYTQLIQIVHDLYCMRLRLGLSTSVPILTAAAHYPI